LQLNICVYAGIRAYFFGNFVFAASRTAIAVFAGMGALPAIGHVWLRATSNVPFYFNDLPSKQLATDLHLLMRISGSGETIR
jgi:hypothetical protein